MNLQFLKYFITLAEELHFSKAAEKLSITQPPLSLAMKNLEEELGVSLFNRSTKKVELTPEGLFYLNKARKIISQVEAAQKELYNFHKGYAATLKIGFSPSLTFRGVLELVNDFEKAHSNIHFIYQEMPLVEQIKSLSSNIIDIGFCNSAYPIFEFNWKKLKQDYFCLCVYEGHHLHEKLSISPADINADDLIVFDRSIGPSNYDLMLRICGANQIKSKFVMQTWLNTISLVSMKQGIAIVPHSMSQLKLQGIKYIPLSGDPIYAHAMMIWGKEKISRPTEIFQDYLNKNPELIEKYFEAT